MRDIAIAIVDASIERAYKERSIKLVASESIIDSIMNDGAMNAAEFGARPMRRAAQRIFEDAVSDAIVHGFLQDGDMATVDVGRGANSNGMSGCPTVLIVCEKDGASLMVEVDDGSGGVSSSAASSSLRLSKAYLNGRDELQPDMML